MTPAQNAAVQQVRQILNEHFDAWVFTTRATDENQNSQMDSHWGGPLDSVIGLSRVTSVRLDRRIIDISGDAEAFTKE